MFAVTMVAILVTMVLAGARAFSGPTVYDRILAANMIGTKTGLLIAVLGFLTERPEFLDLVLIYVLLNFIGMIAVLKLIERGDLGASDDSVTQSEAQI
jgi:multicomponent Na+:H+ antiporter subunit F